MTRLFAGTPFDIPPTCDRCEKLIDDCQCTDAEKAAAQQAEQRLADRLDPREQTANIRVESRKGGRRVTVITGLSDRANDLPSLLTQLQSACGTGGTVKVVDGHRQLEDQIELQGKHAEEARRLLTQLGYRVR
ncbi:MAG: translation initiation factor [Planctomycetota bacterium]